MVEPIYAVIEDFYTPDELQLIWRELEFLTPKLHESSLTGTAKDEITKEYLKKAKGIFLHLNISNNICDITKINRKIFNVEILDNLININPLFRALKTSGHDTTLINYYENNDYYKNHSDATLFTAVSFHYKEPKNFSGGDFIFNDFNLKIEIKNNMLIIFPGAYYHEVTEVIMNKKDLNKGLGRYSMTQFINNSIIQ